MDVANTLAYYYTATVTAVKSFIVHTPECHFAECCYAECRGTSTTTILFSLV